MNNNKKILCCQLIRLIALGIRFITLLLLAKYLSNNEFGEYALILSSGLIFNYIVGLELHSCIKRIISKGDNKNISKYLYNNWFVYIIGYLVWGGLSLFIINYLKIENINTLNFVLFLITEHIFAEICLRYLIFREKQIQSNIINMLKNGIILFILLYLVYISNLTIELIFMFKIISNLICIFVGVLNLDISLKAKYFKLDKSIIYHSLYISKNYLVYVLALRLIEYIERILITKLLGKDVLGVYAFYVTIINLIIIMLDTTSNVYLPKLVKYYELNRIKYNKLTNEYKKKYITISIMFSLVMLMSSPILFILLDKEIYDEHINIFYLLFIPIMVKLIFNYNITIAYSMLKDKIIMYSGILILIIFTLISYISILYFDLYGVILYNSIFLLFGSAYLIKNTYEKHIIHSEQYQN